MHCFSKTNNPSTFQSSHFKPIDPLVMSNITSVNIKQSQMISTIMDTIQQKTDDPDSLKMSLRKFDLQLLTMYGSTKSQMETNNMSQKDNYMTTIMTHQKSPIPQQNNHRSSSTGYKPSQNHSTKKLSIPKPNTLTDKFMQQVLGPQEQLIEQYDRTVNPRKYQQQAREEMRDNVRQEWKRSAISCDRKASCNNNVMEFQDGCDVKMKAFYDQQYYTYLKTNMKYLAQMNTSNNAKNTSKQLLMSQFNKRGNIQDSCQHTNKHEWTVNSFAQPSSPFLQKDPSLIVKKIQQTGGIQNTIGKMERSLKKNEIKHLKVNEYLQRKHVDNIQKKSMQFVNSTSKRLTFGNDDLESQSTNSKDYSTIDKTSKRPNPIPILQQKLSLNSTQHSFFNNEADKTSSFVVQNIIDNAQQQPGIRSNWREKSQSMRNLIEKSLDKR